jgi:DNA-binding response OmpR family regulator
VHTDDASIRAGLDAGADGYITKPIEDNMLQSWIQASIRISALRRALNERDIHDPGDMPALMERFSKLSHSINNPLQSVMASADLLSMEMDGNGEFQNVVETIQENVERIAAMVGEASRLATAYHKTLGHDGESQDS